jgi:hypothetical protein
MMQTQMIQTLLGILVLVLTLGLFPSLVQAQQPEMSIPYDEGVIAEPISLHYGEYTVHCEINPVTDLDRFRFVGSAGDTIRVLVRQTSGRLDPRLEIRDPQGNELYNEFCYDACTLQADLTLTESGTYLLLISDEVADQTGSYTLQLERIPPVSTPPVIAYDFPVNDTIDPVTDIDFFTFSGAENTEVRILVRQTGGRLDPRLAIRDPQGNELYNEFCYDACTLQADLALTESGTYLLLISDEVADQTGSYQISVQCLFGNCPVSSLPVLTQGPLIRGQEVRLIVTGAEEGEMVIFAYSFGDPEDGPCFPALGGLCVDLPKPQRPDSVPADAAGTATLAVTIPLTAPAGQEITTQAVIRRGVDGDDSVKTNTVTDVIQ